MLLHSLANTSYKRSVEFDLIFLSDEDFLYRQKGQTKLDSSILEEFFWELYAKVRKWRSELGKCRAGSGFECPRSKN